MACQQKEKPLPTVAAVRHRVAGLENRSWLTVNEVSFRNDPVVSRTLTRRLLECAKTDKGAGRIIQELPFKIVYIYIHPKTILHQGNEEVKLIAANLPNCIFHRCCGFFRKDFGAGEKVRPGVS